MGKVILITGAGNGIGRASAEQLISEGHIVYGADIDYDSMAGLESLGGHRLKMDVTDGEQVRQGIEKIIKEQGRIDCLHANAGYTLMGMIECTDVDDAIRQFDVNVWGVVRVINSALPYMREQKSGRILITSSVVGDLAAPGMAYYPASKHALEALGSALRMELRPHNIQVSMLKPGFLNTKLIGASMPTLDKAEQSPAAGAYVKQHKAFRENFTKGFTSGGDANSVLKAISHAFNAKSPKRRYMPNFDSKLGVFAKRFFPAALVEKAAINTFID